MPINEPNQEDVFSSGQFWVDCDWFQKLIAKGHLLEQPDFARALGWSSATVDKALEESLVFCFEDGDTRLFPSFFASSEIELQSMQHVSALLGDLPAISKLFFFTAPKNSLAGDSPLEALRKKCYHHVELSVRIYLER